MFGLRISLSILLFWFLYKINWQGTENNFAFTLITSSQFLGRTPSCHERYT